FAQSGGVAMMFNFPSALAAATRASMPPQAVADVAVLAVDSLHEADVLLDVPPHAATMKVATTARPRRREKLPKFIPFDSLPESEPGAGWHTQVRQGQYCGPADDVARTEFACAVDFS